ncbi:MAG TPA: DUF5615 family PIN-like protein [Vicinamibacterales bacterium]|nr:DUF5615 family PIN-like protein [Acidobacteriota bacterium]HOC17180.1 DUF5615 family PIN-like protein [Vicinamibacterales bacterium]
MKSLASELSAVAERLAGQPRMYADANVPAGLVTFMRVRLRWDVLFVTEHDDLRRQPDTEHFRLAAKLRRTLLTLDRDYLDDRRFPPSATAGVLVIAAPDENGLSRLLSRLDRAIFRPRPRRGKARVRPAAAPLPLEGRKLHAHPDWRPAPR